LDSYSSDLFDNILLAALSDNSASILYLSVVIVVLLACSAVISGSEVAFFSLSPVQLNSLRKSESIVAKNVVQLLDNPKLLLATILILNNTVNVGIVTIATYISWEIAGKEDQNAIFIFSIIVTTIIVFFGEILPKVFATQYNLKVAQLMAMPFLFLTYVMRPFSFLLSTLSGTIEKRVRRRSTKVSVSVTELEEAVEMTTGGAANKEQKEILRGIVKFGTKSVKQIMQPRLEITAVDIELTFHQLIDQINKCGYSRLPVYADTIDKVEGILFVKDILPYLSNDEHFHWQELIRKDVLFIIENKKIDTLLKDFQEKHIHMAIVIDEYGGTIGLVTMEDIIEEIVGEINDEFDYEEVTYKKIDDNTYIFEGQTSLNDVCKVLNIDEKVFEEAKGESESIGGLLLELFSKIPTSGESVSFKNFTFTAVAVNLKKIKSVKVCTRPVLQD
jgi:gliding motility-associated protein GldE